MEFLKARSTRGGLPAGVFVLSVVQGSSCSTLPCVHGGQLQELSLHEANP